MARYYKTEYKPVMGERRVIQLLLHRSDLSLLAEFLDPDDQHTTLMDLERDLARVNKAFDSLPEKKRERIEVYLFGQMSQEEQAKRFNTSQPNVKRDFLRAVGALIRLMSTATSQDSPGNEPS